MTKTLFDRPIAHTGDPITSYEAGDRMIKSGALNRQENGVLQAAKIYVWHLGHKDFTARELANAPPSWLDYFLIQRRLSGLHNKGKIVRTGQKRNGCCVWALKNK